MRASRSPCPTVYWGIAAGQRMIRTISGDLDVPLPGGGALTIPGYMVWAALVYAIGALTPRESIRGDLAVFEHGVEHQIAAALRVLRIVDRGVDDGRFGERGQHRRFRKGEVLGFLAEVIMTLLTLFLNF